MKKPQSLTERNFETFETSTSKNKKQVRKIRDSKSHSYSLLKLNSQDTLSIGRTNKLLRSKIFSISLPKKHEAPPRTNLYQKFAKDLNIKLPSPKQKFIEFLKIPPFNRLKNHTDFLAHMLKAQYQFFKKHPSEVIDNIAHKIIELDLDNIPANNLIILDEGTCFYQQKKIEKGHLIVRKNFNANYFSHSNKDVRLLGLNSHDYSLFVSQYLNDNMDLFKKFIKNVQIFKIFPQISMQKICTSLNVHFFSKGEVLYAPGQDANDLYLIYDGVVARKIVVEIDQTNKIPLQKYSKLVKVFSRYYQHKILFIKEDLVGVADIIDNIGHRSEQIFVDEDCTILTIDRVSIEQSLDQYIIDRFRKYNMKKYPKNYDQLCQNYFKQKIQNRKAEQRKILALRGGIESSQNEKKSEKISGIINFYKQRIKQQEKQHLIRKKKLQRVVQSQN